jgi:hypothetical protein
MQKNEKSLGEGGDTLADGVLGSGAAKGNLGLFLLPAGRPGCRFTRADDEAAKASTEALFFLPRGRPRPRFSTGAPRFKRDPLASAMEAGGGKETLDEFERRKMVRRKS